MNSSNNLNEIFGISWIDNLNAESSSENSTRQHNMDNRRICYICAVPIDHLDISILKQNNFACELCCKAELSTTPTLQLPKELTISQCPTCQRYQKPPYVFAEWESKEMLYVLLNRIKIFVGKNKIESADFIYSEPHSKKLKLRLTIQDSVSGATGINVVDFKIGSLQCSQCQRAYTPHQYHAVVQVRLKTRDKSAITSIFNDLMTQKTVEKAIGAMEQNYGFDLYFRSRSDAMAVVHTVEATHVVKTDQSKTLKSHNSQNNTYDYIFTFGCTILNVKKYDVTLIYEDNKIIGVGLIDKIGINIHMLSLPRFEKIKLSGHSAANYNILEICNKMDATKFMVIDVEEEGHLKLMNVKYNEATLEYDVHDAQILCARSPLCEHLIAGDIVAGYRLLADNGVNRINECLLAQNFKEIAGLPDVLIYKTVKDHNFTNRERTEEKVLWPINKNVIKMKHEFLDDKSLTETTDVMGLGCEEPKMNYTKFDSTYTNAFRNIKNAEDLNFESLLIESCQSISNLQLEKQTVIPTIENLAEDFKRI